MKMEMNTVDYLKMIKNMGMVNIQALIMKNMMVIIKTILSMAKEFTFSKMGMNTKDFSNTIKSMEKVFINVTMEEFMMINSMTGK